MQPSARENYLVTEVMTATPQKLQLMLIEAAIRSITRARQKWHAAEDEQAGEAMIHAQQIVGELLASLDAEVETDLVKKVASVYLFVFRTLMEAQHERDEKKLDDAQRVLEVERGTWLQVCEQLGSNREADDLPGVPAPPPPAARLTDLTSDPGTANDSIPPGLSLEA